MSTRAAQALCAIVALAHSDVELEMQLQAGAGAEIQQPLALTIIAGLIASTLLTLLVIPVVYRVAER